MKIKQILKFLITHKLFNINQTFIFKLFHLNNKMLIHINKNNLIIFTIGTVGTF
jgi:hypothetical protein